MMNNFTALGRITRDPEPRQSTSGNPYCRFTLAVDSYQGDANFIPCVCFGRTAESMCKYVVKGQQLLVQGPLESGQYQDNNGIRHYTLDVLANQIDFLQKPQSARSQQQEDATFTAVDKGDELPF